MFPPLFQGGRGDRIFTKMYWIPTKILGEPARTNIKMTQFDVSQAECTSAPVSYSLENLIIRLRASSTPAEAIAVLQQALTQESDRLVQARIYRSLNRE